MKSYLLLIMDDTLKLFSKMNSLERSVSFNDEIDDSSRKLYEILETVKNLNKKVLQLKIKLASLYREAIVNVLWCFRK